MGRFRAIICDIYCPESGEFESMVLCLFAHKDVMYKIYSMIDLHDIQDGTEEIVYKIYMKRAFMKINILSNLSNREKSPIKPSFEELGLSSDACGAPF